MIPSLFPYYDSENDKLCAGSAIEVCSFCAKSFERDPRCRQHYAGMKNKPEGYYQCPAGFTSRSFHFSGNMWVITGVVAYPRFDTDTERALAKKFPKNKTAREDIERARTFFADIEKRCADEIEKAAQVFPQAFHELRKLNAAVLQHAEKELREAGESKGLLTIHSAAELMRNNFDILEALSNIDGMRALPAAATINIFDLFYKTKCVLKEKASARKMSIAINGVQPIIRGNQKSFPIVPAVLFENAIKYGRQHTVIKVEIAAVGTKAVMTVDNETDYSIDPVNCFNRGSRYAGNSVEGGGFGLFLAREIVLAHGGEIRCELHEKSVRMVVELPLKEVKKGTSLA